jgi:hypothetical protein
LGTEASADPLVRYFSSLDRGDISGCLACFAEDATYTRPESSEATLSGSAPVERVLITVRGRSAIGDYLEQMKGLAGSLGLPPGMGPHELLTCLRTDRHSFVEGRVPTGLGNQESVFLALAEIDGADLISRYLAMATVDTSAVVG